LKYIFSWFDRHRGSKPSYFLGLEITDTLHSVGLITWTSDQRAQRSIPDSTQHSQVTDMHATGGIRTHNPNKRAAADQRFSTVHFNKITHEETTHLLVRSDKRTSYPTLMASGITLLSRTCIGHLRIKMMLKEQRGTTEIFGKLLYVPHSHTHILLRDFRAKL
jgi:hypothetical protein